jgi:NAD(P)-dependent dehydrogenase (short-subunit alcohol dehydrogenase family)
MTQDTPIWLITGCSSGLGRALAETCISQGLRVVATARDADKMADLAKGAEDRVLTIALDVTDHAQIAAAVAATLSRFGRIDVLVNNAGYGYQSTAEEGVEQEIRAQFDANVFGLFAMTRAVLPVMRAQRSGHILNMSSVGGLIGFPGSPYYAASKHAVEGFSDGLAGEVGPLGIGVTCVEPGYFRTDWGGRSLHRTPIGIADYAPVIARHEYSDSVNGRQPGDPRRAAEAMIAVTRMADPPRHLVLGKSGYETVVADRRRRLAQIEAMEDVAAAADFPDGA